MKKLINKICDSIIRTAEKIEAENAQSRMSTAEARVMWENSSDEYCRVKPSGLYTGEIGTLEFVGDGRVYLSTIAGSELADTSLECGRLRIGAQNGAVAEYDAWNDTVSYLGYTFASNRVRISAEPSFAA